jgi:hypothetical protein
MNNMKAFLIFFIIVLSASILSAQETKVIKGRIISEDLELLPKAMIYNMDTIVLGSTDLDGYFKIEVPVETNKLLLGFIGMEWTLVKIENNCQNLEMIMMTDVIYDFIPIKRINSKRHKRFKELPKKYLEAYGQGIFISSVPCVSYVFKKY